MTWKLRVGSALNLQRVWAWRQLRSTSDPTQHLTGFEPVLFNCSGVPLIQLIIIAHAGTQIISC